MSIGTILQHHRITLKNLDKLSHRTGRKRGGGCLGCHCRTPKYATWGIVFSFPCCNECFDAIRREAKAQHERDAEREAFTMSIDDLLTQLSDANIRVRVTPDGLRVTNASALTDNLRRSLRGHRDQIIKELSLPLTEYALLVFGGAEIDNRNKPVKAKKQEDAGLF